MSLKDLSLFHRKDPNESYSDATPRVLGGFQLVALGIGTVIGAGLFALTGVAAAQNAGPAVVLSFLVAALACGFVGLCYAELASACPDAGGAGYSYSYAALGEMPAFLMGWTIVMQYVLLIATVASSWSGYLVSLLGQWHIALDPHFIGSPSSLVTLASGVAVHPFCNLPAMLCVVAVCGLLFLGMGVSSKINALLVALKISVIIAFIAFLTPHIELKNYVPFIPQNTGTFGEYGLSGIARGAALLFMAYMGFDAVAMTARETVNPQKNLPIGILGSLGVCALIFVLFALVLVGAVPYTRMLGDASPVATAINVTGIPALSSVLKASIIVGFLAVIYGSFIAASSILTAMAQDGLLPRFLSKRTKRHAPIFALALITLIAVLLSGFLPLASLGGLASMGTLLGFVGVCVSAARLRKLHPDLKRPFKLKGPAWLIPALGAVPCVLLMLAMDLATWKMLGAWLVLGCGFYLFFKIRKHV